MKKFIIWTLVLFILSCLVGYYYGDKIFNKYEKVALENDKIINENEVIPTSGKEIKILSSTKFGIKKKFKGCSHTSFEFVELPLEAINLTKEEMGKKYSGWQIEEFEENKVVLFKEIDGICDEHFIIKAGEEFIEIYRIMDEENNTCLYKRTDISTEYLAEEDLEKLKTGIKIYGKDKLNSIIEDFE